MEKPASDEAIREYNRKMRERYGDEIVQASRNLYKNPSSPEAHRLYVKAIRKMLEQ